MGHKMLHRQKITFGFTEMYYSPGGIFDFYLTIAFEKSRATVKVFVLQETHLKRNKFQTLIRSNDVSWNHLYVHIFLPLSVLLFCFRKTVKPHLSDDLKQKLI